MSTIELSFRPVREDDFDWLLELRRETMNPHFERVGKIVDEELNVLRLRDHYDDIEVIESDGQIVGMIKAYREENGWYLGQVQIVGAYRNQGIGARVISRLLEQAKQDRLPISLWVLKGNPAERLYKRLGFEIVGETETSLNMKLTQCE